MSATPAAESPPLREEAAPNRAASSDEEADQASHAAHPLAGAATKPADRIAAIRKCLGNRTVLIRVAPLGKNPTEKEWQRIGVERMDDPAYMATLNHDCNIGVALGAQSAGLCTLDLDDTEELAKFLACNPDLAETLRTTRVRGANFWLQIEGDYPASGITRNREGKAIGEWRSTGNQTVISGAAIDRRKGETEPTKYRVISKTSTPARLAFSALAWPADWRLPWNEPERPKRGPGRDNPSNADKAGKPGKAQVREMLAVIPRALPYEEWLRVIAAVGDALDDGDAVEALNEWDAEDEPGLYAYKLARRLAEVHVGTLFHMARWHGWQPGEPWPDVEPLPPEHPPVALFDYDLLPSVFAAYTRDVAERMQCPPDYVAVGLMCSVGNLVGRKVGIHPKRKDDWLEVCNLWGGVVGPPSIMKSPALSDAMLPLNTLVAEAIERHKVACAEFADAKEVRAAGKDMRKAALAKELKERGESAALDMAKKQRTATKDEPICERLTVNDVTAEKLGMMLNENPNGLLQFRDELAGWLRSMDKDGHENDRAFFLECWNGKGSYTSDRVERGTTHIEAAIVGVLGGIQPGVLSKYIREATGSGSGSDGLLQRFNLIVWPEITPLFVNIDRYPNKEAKEAVMDVFRRLHAMTSADLGATTDYSTIPALRFTHEAQDRFDQWREGFENGLRSSDEHPALVAHLTKHRKAVPVLALLDHLCDGDTGAVGLKSLEKAIRWHAYLKSHAAKVYGGIRNGGAAPAREILRRINEGDIKDGFTARDVYRRELAGLDDRATVESGINALLAANYVREDITTTAGKSIVRHRIHPSLYPSGAQGNQPPLLPKRGSSPEKGAFGSNGSEVSKAAEGESEAL